MATSYDGLREVGKKYADNCLEKLKSNYGKNVRVLHSVNATSLSQTLPEDLKKIYFDAVVFHYPHTGQQRTHLNRNLVRDFLSSAGPYIKPNTGEIHITLKQEAPYKFWNVSSKCRKRTEIHVKACEYQLWMNSIHSRSFPVVDFDTSYCGK